jgi:hypothetical protein
LNLQRCPHRARASDSIQWIDSAPKSIAAARRLSNSLGRKAEASDIQIVLRKTEIGMVEDGERIPADGQVQRFID